MMDVSPTTSTPSWPSIGTAANSTAASPKERMRVCGSRAAAVAPVSFAWPIRPGSRRDGGSQALASRRRPRLRAPRAAPAGARHPPRMARPVDRIGQIVTGMVREGYHLHLTNIEEGAW